MHEYIDVFFFYLNSLLQLSDGHHCLILHQPSNVTHHGGADNCDWNAWSHHLIPQLLQRLLCLCTQKTICERESEGRYQEHMGSYLLRTSWSGEIYFGPLLCFDFLLFVFFFSSCLLGHCSRVYFVSFVLCFPTNSRHGYITAHILVLFSSADFCGLVPYWYSIIKTLRMDSRFDKYVHLNLQFLPQQPAGRWNAANGGNPILRLSNQPTIHNE